MSRCSRKIPPLKPATAITAAHSKSVIASATLEMSHPKVLISVTTRIPSQTFKYAISSFATSSSDMKVAPMAASTERIHEARIAGSLEKAAELGGKGLDAGLRAAEDQGVDVVRAFVGIDHLQVDDVADDAELVGDAVAAQHIAREARDLQRLAARVALHDRGDLD